MRRKLGKYYYVSDSSAQQESEGVTVKLGRDSRTNRSVIVKVFENSAFKTSAGARELVKFEIETMSRTSGHPHVVQLSDVLVSPSHLFVIMDKVHGGDLFDVVAAEGRMWYTPRWGKRFDGEGIAIDVPQANQRFFYREDKI